MNHAYAMTNPKGTLTFSRNAAARDHSAIHVVNNIHANSIVKKCEAAGCPISAGSPAASALASIDKKQEYHKQHAKSKDYKKRRAHCRAVRFNTSYHMKTLYKSGQLDPKPVHFKCTTYNYEGHRIFMEHSYCKMFSKSLSKKKMQKV